MTQIQNPDDTQLTEILRRAKVVACVGASANPDRPSHFVSVFLTQRGLRVIPVNPGLAGQQLWGETVYASFADIPADLRQEIDFLDIFRRSEDVPDVVEAALHNLPNLRCVWMQVGVTNEAAASSARAKGIDVVQNRCPKVEFPRLLGG